MTLLKNSWVSWAPCSWAASPRAESTLKDSTRAPLNCSAASFTLCCCCSSIGSSSSFLLLACPDSFDGTLTVRAQGGRLVSLQRLGYSPPRPLLTWRRILPCKGLGCRFLPLVRPLFAWGRICSPGSGRSSQRSDPVLKISGEIFAVFVGSLIVAQLLDLCGAKLYRSLDYLFGAQRIVVLQGQSCSRLPLKDPLFVLVIDH